MGQKYILEEIDNELVGRVYVNGVKTSAYIIPCKDNYNLFSDDQLKLINNQTF